MRLRSLLGIAGAAALMLSAAQARALQIVSTNSFTDLLTELDDEPLRVDLFDPANGTLDSVVVEIAASLNSSGSVTNNSAGPEDFSVQTIAQIFTATGVSLPAVLAGSVPVIANNTVIASEVFIGLASGATAPFGPDSTSLTTELLNTAAPGLLAQFVGIGQFGYDLNTLIGTLISGAGGNVATNITTLASASLTVTYNFSVNPPPPPPPTGVAEPATLALLGFGLLGAGAAVRRRLRG